MDKRKVLVVFTSLLNVIGVGIIIPILPFYVSSFGASPLTVTLLFSVFSFFAFFSAPLLGSVSDRYGRKPVLIISLLSTAVGWFVFAGAHSLFWLFVGRIIDGAAAGNVSAIQGYMADISKDEKERMANMGTLGAVMGVGIIIGPALGGLLSSVSYSFPFWFSGGIVLLNAVLVCLFLPESHVPQKEVRVSLNPATPFLHVGKNKFLLALFGVWFLFQLATMNLQSIFALYLDEVFNYGPQVVSGLFMGMGLLIILNQGFAIKHFWLKHFSEARLEYLMLALTGMGFLMQTGKNLVLFVLGLIFLAFGQGVLRVVMTSQTAGAAGNQSRGEILGALSAVASLAAVLGPLMGGWLFEAGYELPFFASAIMMFFSVAIVYFFKNRFKNIQLPEDVPDLA